MKTESHVSNKNAVRGLPSMSQKLIDFLKKEEARVSFEWNNWDGSKSQAIEINDKQCARIDSFRLATGA